MLFLHKYLNKPHNILDLLSHVELRFTAKRAYSTNKVPYKTLFKISVLSYYNKTLSFGSGLRNYPIVKLFLISNKYNIIKNYILAFFSQVETLVIAKLKPTIFDSPIVMFFQERRRAIADAFSIGTLFLVFFKFISIIITGFYPIIFINISLLFIIFLFSYYYELMIKIKTFIIKYYYYNQYIIARDYLAKFLTVDPEILAGNGHHLSIDLYNYKNLKKYHFTQNLFFHFHVLLFQLRLIFLAEPYIFILFRMFILYLLIYNKLFFFAAIISIIGIFSRILFHMSFWDMTDVKKLYLFLSWDPLFLVKSNDENIVLFPTKNNAKILYALSFLGIISNMGTLEEALTTWKMSTIYINNNKEIEKKYEDHYLKFQVNWLDENDIPRSESWIKARKPYYHHELARQESFIYVYLKHWGIKFNFKPFYLGDVGSFTETETVQMFDNLPDNFLTSNGQINYIMDGTYKKNQIFIFLFSFIFMIFSTGLLENYFISTVPLNSYMEFSEPFLPIFNRLSKSLSTKHSYVHTPLKQAPKINQTAQEVQNVTFQDYIPIKGILTGHPISLGMDPRTKYFYVVNTTTHNPDKIHKGQGLTNVTYHEQRQSIISLSDIGKVITPENPEYETYLKIYHDKSKLSPNQTIAGLLNEGKISPIGFEDEYQQKLLKDNIPGYDEWQKKVYTWDTSDAIISPVPNDVLGMKRLQNAQAVLRVEQSADAQEFLVSTCKEVKKTSVKSVSDLANIILENNSRFILPKTTAYHSTYNKALFSKEDLENKAKYEAKNNLYYAPDLQSPNTNYIANIKRVIPEDEKKESFEAVILPQESYIKENGEKKLAPYINSTTPFEEGQKKELAPVYNKLYINQNIDNRLTARRVPGQLDFEEKTYFKKEKQKYKESQLRKKQEKDIEEE